MPLPDPVTLQAQIDAWVKSSVMSSCPCPDCPDAVALFNQIQTALGSLRRDMDNYTKAYNNLEEFDTNAQGEALKSEQAELESLKNS